MITDSGELDYIIENLPFGLYAWPQISITHLDPDLDWHTSWQNADTGIKKFKNKVNLYIQAAQEKKVGLHIVMCAGLARGLAIYREAKEEDIRNCQWYNDNKLATVPQLTEADALDKYVFGTLSRYARKMHSNLYAKAQAALAFIKKKITQNPQTFLSFSGWGEAELNFNRINQNKFLQDHFCDYSPFAVLEFRDWIRHTGMYAPADGEYSGQGYSGGGDKYQGTSGLATFNQDFGTNFNSWKLKYYHWDLSDEYDSDPTDNKNNDPHRIPFSEYTNLGMLPVSGPEFVQGGFDPPRTMQPGQAFWDLWNLFRETMVKNYVLDLAKWAADAGIPARRWFSHQLAGDYLFGTNPEMENKNPRYYTSASPLWTADIRPYGLPGVTFYDVKFPDWFARTTEFGLDAISALTPDWVILEYDAETYPQGLNVPASSVADILAQYLHVHSYGPRLINFWRWEDATGEHQIKGKNKEKALKQFIAAVRDKIRSDALDTVYDPPQVKVFSGQHNQASGSNVLTIGREIWLDQPWEWKDWGDFARFELFRGLEPGFPADASHLLVQTKEYSYTDATAVKGNTYYYRVRVVNSKGKKGSLSPVVKLPQGDGFILSLQAETGGTTDPPPGIYDYTPGTHTSVSAVPDETYFFSFWGGDATGVTNPLSVLMDRDKSVTANFSRIEIYAPLNFQGEKVIFRAWMLSESAHRLTWAPDPRNSNVAFYRLYERADGTLFQVAEVAVGIHEFLRRGIEQDRSYFYEIVAVNTAGHESPAAEIYISG